MTFQDDSGNILDIKGDFAMTKQSVSFFNLKIKGDISINFEVPNNSVTRKTLNYNGPQMINQVAFTKQPFNRVRNGNILDRGYIVIQSEEPKSLNCFYVSGNSNWINLLTGLITDLNWDSYLVQINKANVLSKASATSGITFPYVDWSYDLKNGFNTRYIFGDQFGTPTFKTVDATNDVEVSFQDFYPCLYLSSLIQECFTQNGLKFSGDVLNDTLFKSLVLTPVNGQMKRIPFKTFTAYGSSQSFAAFGPYKYTSFTTISDPDGAFNVGTNKFTINKTQSLHFTGTCNSASASALPITFLVYKNGVVIPGSVATFTLYVGQSVRTKFPVPCSAGDIIEVYLNSSSAVGWNASVNLKIDSPELIYTDDYVEPSNFLPKLSCVDITKFIIGYFGCTCNYDEYSKKLTVNIIDNIKKENALDWSEYYISHRTEYTVQQAKNNYVRLQSPDESDLQKYNSQNKIGFGEGVITTGNTLNPDHDLFKIPFAPTSYGIDYAGVWQANIPLVSLEDDGDPIPYTAITDLGGGQAKFTVSIQFNKFEVIRILDNNGVSLGYHQVYIPSATDFITYFQFTNSFSGTILRQRISYNDITPRILSCKQTSFPDYASSVGGSRSGNKSGFYFIADAGTLSVETNTSYAVFSKYKTNEPIDQWQTNCAFDNPDITTFQDITVKQRYFNTINKFLQNGNVRAQMLLPESVYQSFDFSNFIYLKTEKLTGYFFIDSIVNYQEASKPVEVNLYML